MSTGWASSSARRTDQGNQSYFLHDGLDSIRELTNSSGTGVSDYFYAAFGADRGSTWSQRSATTEYNFNGQQDDPTLGLYYLRARYYDPYTGRFLSKDPFPGTHCCAAPSL